MNIKNLISTKKRKIIALSTIIIVIAILGTFVGLNLSYSSKVKQADEATNGKDYDKAVTLYGQALNIFNKSDTQSKLSNAEELQKSQKDFNEATTEFDSKGYYMASLLFQKVIKEDTANYDNAVEKAEESKNLYVAERIDTAKKNASTNDYSKAITALNDALNIDSTNNEALDLRDKYKSAKADSDAKDKAEFDAKNKANDEAAKKAKEEEAKKYQPQKIVDSNGKQIWKVYISNGSFHFTGTYKGTGNFIVQLSDSNQDLVAVIANEIGDFISDKTVQVGNVGWYYLEIRGSDGKWDYKWN